MRTTRLPLRQALILAVSVLTFTLACTCLPLPQPGEPEAAVGEETAVTEQATPDPDTLVVRSFPPGAETYVVPKKVAEGMLSTVALTSDEYFVGYTPVETELEPGEYRVTIKHEPAHFRRDGEDDIIFQLVNVEDQENLGVTPIAKVYAITKSADHQAIVTALLWPEGQSLAEFVETLPDDELFTISEEDFEAMLQTHKVPKEDWEHLLTMLRRTGKAAWHGEDPSDYLFIYFGEPRQLSVKWGGAAQPQ